MNKALETERLLPCPFCGMNVTLETDDKVMTFKCPDESPCIGSGLGTFALNKSKAQAIAAWNRRALHKESFDAGWEKAKLLLKPEDLSCLDLSQAERGGEVVALQVDEDGPCPYHKGDVLVCDRPTNFHEVGEVVVVAGTERRYTHETTPFWVRFHGKPGHYAWRSFRRATTDEVAAALTAASKKEA